jgi:hypothetical protein
MQLSDGRKRELSVELPEPHSVDGPWSLTATTAQGVGLTAPVAIQLEKLVSWREIGELRTFAGIASYQTNLDLPPDCDRADLGWVLELGDVYELADVWLNGRHIATSWFPPYSVDLTGHIRPGKNTLRVDVPNILKNHLEAGDYTRPSGLLGPVRLRPVGRVVLQ